MEDLLDHVHAGRIRVPSFQRALRWKKDDIGLLLDSIYRGYPIGTLLFWKHPADAAVVQLGPVRIDAPAHQDAWWVVDGQQRITALTSVLTGPNDDVEADHALFFDLHEEKLARRPPPPHWLPLDQVVDSAVLLTWLQERGDTLEQNAITAAIQLGKRIRAYQLPASVLEADDEQPLRMIFHPINRGGQPLEAADVFRAQHGAAHSPSNLDELAASLGDTGFGRLDTELIREAVLAVSGKDPGRDVQDQLDDGDIPDALARTRSALERVIVFLRKECGIPHEALLPYRSPLITLARFFDRHPEPAARSLALMVRWLWRGAINGRHRGDTVTALETRQAIAEDEVETVQNLLRDVGSRPHEPPPLTPFNANHAHSKLHLLALWALAPRHLLTGAPLRIDEVMQYAGSALPILPMDTQTAAWPITFSIRPWLAGCAGR